MNERRLILADLPLASRLTIAVFLMAVGLGYAAAMVQLHLQHAGPGNILPSPEDVVRTFHGAAGPPKSKLEILIETDEARPFSGNGSMAAAFFKRSDGWNKAIRQLAKDKGIDEPAAEVELRKEREGERQAMLAWVRSGLPKETFESDSYPWPVDKALSADFRNGDAVKIKSLFTARCTRCHAKDGDDADASNYPLETYEQILKYGVPNSTGRMSLEKLAQSTHAHLFAFAVMFAFTGLLFSLTRYPGIFRIVLAPLPLVAQVADIACWWLARIDGSLGEQFALAIPITGMIVGGGLAAQILLTLFDLFGALGKLVLVALLASAGYGAFVAKERVIDPFLKERIEHRPG